MTRFKMMHGGGVIISMVVWVMYSCKTYEAEGYCDHVPTPPCPKDGFPCPPTNNKNDGWYNICPPPYNAGPDPDNPSPARSSASDDRVIALIGFSLITLPLLFTIVYICKQDSSRQTQRPILLLLRSAQVNIPLVGGIARDNSRKGLDPTLVSRLPTVQFSAKALGDEAVVGSGGKDSSCSVCLGEFKDGEMIKILPVCLHIFHGECIDMWLFSHVTCPLCRVSLVEPAVCLTVLQAEGAAAHSVR